MMSPSVSSLVAAARLVDAQANVVSDLAHLAPAMIVAAWALLLLVVDAFSTSGMRMFQRRLALLGVGLAFAVTAYQTGQSEYDGGITVFSGALVVDQFALYLDLVILGIAGLVLSFAGEFARHRRFEYGEQEALVLISAFGALTIVHAGDFLSLYLGIETMSIAAYVLVGARWNSKTSPEAALKYFLMGAFASGLMLMGIALLYGATGTTNFNELSNAIPRVFHAWRASQVHVDIVLNPDLAPASAVLTSTEEALLAFGPVALFFPGMLLVLAALLFKVSAVPFHMWTPDVYEGAPTPVTAWMAAGVKTGGLAALLKVFVGVFNVRILIVEPYGWTSVLALLAFLTMTIGNFAAVGQSRIKRLLAYSSVAHVGYLLVGVVAAASFYGAGIAHIRGDDADEVGRWAMQSGDAAITAVLYYLLVYGVATVGCFAVVAFYGDDDREADEIDHWSGLAERHPALALGMTVCLLSLLGMPPLAGFFGKVGLFRAALANENPILHWLVVAAVLNAVLGAYYYLRLIVAMYFRPTPSSVPSSMPGRGAPAVVIVTALLSLVLGVGADRVLQRCRLAAAGMAFRVGSPFHASSVEDVRASWARDAARTKGGSEGGAPVDKRGAPEGGAPEPAEVPARGAPEGGAPEPAEVPARGAPEGGAPVDEQAPEPAEVPARGARGAPRVPHAVEGSTAAGKEIGRPRPVQGATGSSPVVRRSPVVRPPA